VAKGCAEGILLSSSKRQRQAEAMEVKVIAHHGVGQHIIAVKRNARTGDGSNEMGWRK
jgi:hypothetical protein